MTYIYSMRDLNFNIFNLIIFAGIIQGLIFSFIILVNKNYKSKTNNFIAYTVLSLTLSNLQYWFIDINVYNLSSFFNKLRIPCDVLIVPTFYLFVKSYLNLKKNKAIINSFIIIFSVNLIFNLFYYFNILFSKNGFRNINILLETFSFILNLTLIIIIFRIVINYEITSKNYNKHIITNQTKWIKHILIIGGIICLFWFIIIMYMQSKYHIGGLQIYYPLWICISFLVYWISYVAIINSKVKNERVIIRQAISQKKEISSLKPITRVNNSTLYCKITHYIKNDKAYLNPDISIKIIARKFNKSEGYISQIISANNSLNFSEIINSFRIATAKEMLVDKNFNNYTITAIGLEAGFKSRSSFYSAFKKLENKTPMQFKKDVQNS